MLSVNVISSERSEREIPEATPYLLLIRDSSIAAARLPRNDIWR
jgi:hypothetical protein